MQQMNLPRDLLDNLSDERSSLAKMSLGSRDSGLNDTRFGFLIVCVSPSIFFHLK